MTRWGDSESNGAVRHREPIITETVVSGAWTLLTNHSHVLVCLADDPDSRVRDIAERVGITERAVQRILAELEDSGIVSRQKDGRRNHYAIHGDVPLRHSLEAHCTVNDLLNLFRR
ncbi:MAG: winged helix-turn-helix domain-containing protein [Capsulimonadales bacterium]|nr:winged helix-turn-helix domain-containing protein [Capsulimonadales bacterium]